MKVSRVFLNIMSVVCFIYGALYCFSLVFIPIGVYCFIAGRVFSKKAENVFDPYTVNSRQLKIYTIFSCVFCFPLGLLSLVPYYILTSNNVKVSNVHEQDNEDKNDNNVEIKTISVNESEAQDEQPEQEEKQKETQEEKLEKFEKLKNFNKKGIITDDELEMARKQLFGDGDKE